MSVTLTEQPAEYLKKTFKDYWKTTDSALLEGADALASKYLKEFCETFITVTFFVMFQPP